MKPVAFAIKNFAHLEKVEFAFGDLTVLVGPQGVGKSLALQWLKTALDGKQIVDALGAAGNTTDNHSSLVSLIFGSGMKNAWHDDLTEVVLDGKRVNPKNFKRIGDGKERLLFVPAQRSMLISDGWAAPFQKLSSDIPVVARLFSQCLFDRLSNNDVGKILPTQVPNLFQGEIRAKLDEAIYHGGKLALEQNLTRRLQLVHGKMQLPFMTWTTGQREFTPLLVGLSHLLPWGRRLKDDVTEWVVIEEPELGLHPQAITAILLLVLDLLSRGLRVVLSTHSPHVLTMLWMMRQLQEFNADWKLVCEAFGVQSSESMRKVAKAALGKDYRAHLLQFTSNGKVVSKDISTLDPDSQDDAIAGWGGLTEYSSHFGDVVRIAANRAEV